MPELSNLLEPIQAFLNCETPSEWLLTALKHKDILLIDHCNCEKKAASTAMSLIFKYSERTDLLMKMSKLAREELRHFEQVLKLLQERKVDYRPISASRYAFGMLKHVRTHEPHTLIDKLIVGAYIEARSCERFAKLIPLLKNDGEEELAEFYQSLLRSESRHFKDYITLAQNYADEPIQDRVKLFGEIESALISSVDDEFRFHSGFPGKNL